MIRACPFLSSRSCLRGDAGRWLSRLENKRERLGAVIKNVENFLPVSSANVDQTVTVADAVLHLLRQLQTLGRQDLDAHVRVLAVQLFDFVLRWKFQNLL